MSLTVASCFLARIRSVIPARRSDLEEESDRRQGKGRRCWLVERIDSVPCRTRILAPGRFEEMVE